MPRIRSIKPEAFLDPDLSDLGFAARYFFIGLWCQADREGRLDDESRKLGIQIIPFDIASGKMDAETLLMELTPKFIRRYEVDGKRYIQIVNFCRHQRPNINEASSQIPPELEIANTEMKINRRRSYGKAGTKKVDDYSIKHREINSVKTNKVGFSDFWKVYPRRVGKAAALKAWMKARIDDASVAVILSAVAEQSKSRQWTKDDGQYIPYPASWINDRRWEDESPIKQGNNDLYA